MTSRKAGAGTGYAAPGFPAENLLHETTLTCHSYIMKMLELTMVILLVAGLLNGCAALVVGGAGVGGYVVAKDKRSISEMTSDASITSSINTKFLQDDMVSAVAINVDTHKGVVTLKGAVDTYEAARRAYDLA